MPVAPLATALMLTVIASENAGDAVEPIRARVRIQIFQQNITKTKTGDTTVYKKHDIEYWEQAYAKLFNSNYAGGGSNALQHLNKASNLINL